MKRNLGKKRVLIVALVLIAITVLHLGATLAYFTDKVVNTNVITVGTVKITQDIKDRSGAAIGTDLSIIPAVDQGDNVTIAGNTVKNFANSIDKVVTVNNVGTTDAYVRTIIALPEINDQALLVPVKSTSADIVWTEIANVVIGGKEHTLYVATYANALTAGATSEASLIQVYLDPDTTSADVDGVTTLDVKVCTQAVQASGFANADAAFTASFGAVTADAFIA